MWIFLLTVIPLIIFIFIFLFLKYKHYYWKRRGIYSPPCHWLFGHFKDFFLSRKSPQDIFEYYYNSVDKDVPFIGLYVIHKPFLLLCDPGAMKHVMIKDFHVFPNRQFGYKMKGETSLVKNLFAVTQPEWKRIRTKVSPILAGRKIRMHFLTILENAKNLKNFLIERIEGKTKLETENIVMRFMTDNISSLAFGIRTNSVVNPESEFFKRVERTNEPSFVKKLQYLLLFFFPSIGHLSKLRLLREHTDWFYEVFKDSLSLRERSGKEMGDMIDLLLDLRRKKEYSDEVLFGQAGVMLSAAVAPNSSIVINTLLELAKNQGLQERLHEELMEKVPSELTYESVTQLNYLKQVLSEVLRLYPTTPILDRVAEEDYVFSDYNIRIEKGTPVIIVASGVHRNPLYYPDPLKFDPGRFSKERKNEVEPITYMPFGHGPRFCIGMRIALIQVTVCLATILRNYKITLDDDFEYQKNRGSTFTKELYFEEKSLLSGKII